MTTPTATTPPAGTDVAGNPMPGAATAARPALVKEDEMHLYARQTRNATVFMAWVVAIGVALTAIVGIYLAVTVGHLVSGTGGGGGGGYDIYNCASLGGTDTSC